MAAVNRNPWRKNMLGAKPIIQPFKVAAGSSQVLKVGEICYLDAGSDNMTKVAGTTSNLHALVICNEEQKLADAARFLEFILPTEWDVFEFALDAATVINWGDELQLYTTNPTYQLKKSSTDPVARAVEVAKPQSGTTWPTISTVLCSFYKGGKSSAGLELPWIGGGLGDAS